MSMLPNPYQVVTKRPDGRLRVQTKPVGESLTQQQFAEEADVNNVMRKYALTGVLPHHEGGLYADFSEAVEYKEAMNIVAHANEQFASLSAEVRKRFSNDPAEFLAFVQDPENADEMAKLGLMKEEAVKRVKSERAPRKVEAEAKEEPKAPAEQKKDPVGKPDGAKTSK